MGLFQTSCYLWPWMSTMRLPEVAETGTGAPSGLFQSHISTAILILGRMESLSCLVFLLFVSEVKKMAAIINGSMAVLAGKLCLLLIFGPDFSLDYYISQGKISYPQGKVVLQVWGNCTFTIAQKIKNKKSLATIFWCTFLMQMLTRMTRGSDLLINKNDLVAVLEGGLSCSVFETFMLRTWRWHGKLNSKFWILDFSTAYFVYTQDVAWEQFGKLPWRRRKSGRDSWFLKRT